MSIQITGNCPTMEKMAYVDYLQKKYNRKLKTLDIILDDEGYANLTFTWEPVPFDRIRRITGYLTGNLSTWNDAKKSEEKDRLKHSTSNGMERL